ncbi:MAG: ABC transporter permease [Cellulosilyticaceae bacterium]
MKIISMKISDLIGMSIRSLWRRKLRTFLTILGVIIGASSIILMLSLGIAMNTNFRNQMEGMQSLTVIEVWNNSWDDPNAPKLDEKAVETLSAIPGVQMVVPEESISAYLEIGKYRSRWSMQLMAMDPHELYALGYTADIGEPIPSNNNNYIIFGNGYAREFEKIGKKRKNNYGMNDPIEINIGDTMELNLAELDWETGKPVTGSEGQKVAPPKNVKTTITGMFSEQTQNAYSMYISRDLYKKLKEEKEAYNKKLYGKDSQNNNKNNEGNKYNSLRVKVAKEDDVVEIQQNINDMGYRAYSSMEYLEEMKKVANSIQIILGGIGAISLFVAAIGITNTMMMSIYERTKEIGVMKVIGARLTDIKKMFLMEALMIGAIGGIVGVLFSYMISFIINKFGPQIASSLMMGSSGAISEIPLWLALSALIFSTLIGLISGYFPARRAMKLSALSAIKTE